MLTYLFWGLVTGAAIAAVTIIIDGIITKAKMKAEIKQRDVGSFMVTGVDRINNKISFTSLKNDITGTIQGDGISSEIYEGQKIYV